MQQWDDLEGNLLNYVRNEIATKFESAGWTDDDSIKVAQIITNVLLEAETPEDREKRY